MASVGVGRIVSCLHNFCGFGIRPTRTSLNQIEVIQARNYAARKGTREKARKKKVKVEEKKVGFIPHNLRGKDSLRLSTTSKRIDDSWKSVSTDNVWLAKYYKWRVYSFAEAVRCHQETHHPSIYNMPNASVNVTIELDMHAEKKNRFVDNLNRMVTIPYPFDHGEDRSIIVFCKTDELQKAALASGAAMAGGPELVKDIQTGELLLQDFQYVIAHPNMLADLAVVRGLMKRKFPNPKSGTMGVDIEEMVLRFCKGIQYTSAKDEHEQDFGWIDTTIGNLSMDISQLEGNFAALMKDVNSVRPKREGPFITRVLLKSPPSIEKLKLDLTPYLDLSKDVKKEKTTKQAADEMDEEEEDEEEDERKKAKAAQ